MSGAPPDDTPTPRLFGLLAPSAGAVVVIRRGPSDWAALAVWDLVSDLVETGQWLRGRVYERRCDLSPDGRLMIAALAKHGQGQPGGYTVVCRPPYFTALAIHEAGHCWNGGGAFHADGAYWVDETFPFDGAKRRTSQAPRSRETPPAWVGTPHMGEDLVLYVPRLLRDGWTMVEAPVGRVDPARFVLDRPIRPRWTLRKRLTSSLTHRGRTGALYWETHEIVGPEGVQPLGDEWADVWTRGVVMARDGRLERIRVHAEGPEAPRTVFDASGWARARIEAPYQGVSR